MLGLLVGMHSMVLVLGVMICICMWLLVTRCGLCWVKGLLRLLVCTDVLTGAAVVTGVPRVFGVG